MTRCQQKRKNDVPNLQLTSIRNNNIWFHWKSRSILFGGDDLGGGNSFFQKFRLRAMITVIMGKDNIIQCQIFYFEKRKSLGSIKTRVDNRCFLLRGTIYHVAEIIQSDSYLFYHRSTSLSAQHCCFFK